MTVTTEAPLEIPTQQWGPVKLLPGISKGNMTFYVLGAVFTMLFSTFVPQAQPFILTEILRIPQAQQGAVSGYLGLAATLVGLVMPSLWGALSDKAGRRTVYALGFFVSALGIALYPLAATLVMLYLFRMIFAAGSNASITMNNALLADYVDNRDRGKAFGMTSMGSGVGALLTVFLFMRLPAMFQDAGMEGILAGRYTYWIVAGLGALAAVLMLRGLQGKSRAQDTEKRSLAQITRDGLRAAAQDPAISLAYGINFAASGAMTAIGTFFTLWIVTYGTTQGGLSSADALARAGMIVGISQVMGLVGSPIFGILADRGERVRVGAIAAALTSLAFGATVLIANPLSPALIVLGLFLGFVQISGVITGGALIAQQAPEAARGSVMGFYAFCGSLGIMLVSVLGGWLFDAWLAQGPFVLVACLSLCVTAWGLWVHRGRKR